MSSVYFEEARHKLLRIPLDYGQEIKVCNMLLECCSQQQTYFNCNALLAERFCLLKEVHCNNFRQCFATNYSGIHRLETYRIQNVAKFFGHLLSTDALNWNILACIRLHEEERNSSSQIFIKILFQELCDELGIDLLGKKLNEDSVRDSVAGIFPKDSKRNIQFCINFFTCIGFWGI